MKKNIDKNKIYLGIITFLVVFWTIASIFGFIGYGRSTKHHKASNVITASADTPSVELPNNEVRSFTTNYTDTENLVVYYASQMETDGRHGRWEFVFNPSFTSTATRNMVFTSNNQTYSSIAYGTQSYPSGDISGYIKFGDTTVYEYGVWLDDAYRFIDIVEINSAVNLSFLTSNADYLGGDSTVHDWALLTGKQLISVYRGSMRFNNKLLTDMEGNIEQVNDYYTPFIFSDYQQYNIPTQIIIDDTFDLGFVAEGINAVNRIDCEVFTDGNSIYLYYLLSCSWYESVLDTSSYDFQFAFTVYYDFTEYAVADAIGDAYVYFPTCNESVLFEEEQYFIQYYYDQTAYIADFVAMYNGAYQDGFDAGLGYGGTTDENGFINLISAVIDVPLRTFMSLFDMEILGVNLAGFFLSLLSLCACIAIIRLIL